MQPRHFLSLLDVETRELRALIDRAAELKAIHYRGELFEPLRNKVLAMVFEKSSTRTRVSVEAAMAQFGGSAIFLSPRDAQLGRGEPIEDTARVMSRMVDVVMLRTYAHKTLETFAQHSRVPVINALTDRYHPCQLLADLLTLQEHRGAIEDQVVAWVGDGNNMCHSYINAACQLSFTLRVATPKGYEPNPEVLSDAGSNVLIAPTAADAVDGADLVVTDVWASMGQEEEGEARRRAFGRYQVNSALMKLAKPDALFMHCLPAHRGEEVAAEVLEGPQSVVWEEAENRLHTLKALLELLLA